MYTDTRSVLVSTILFTFIFILLSFIVKIPRIYYNSELLVHLANFLPIFLLVIILKLRQTFQVIDTATSYRLSFISNYIESNSWSNLLFGGTQVKDVDNGFLILIYSLGLFFSLYILIKIIKATHIAFQKNNIRIIAFITSFLVYNLVESAIVRPEVLITMLFWMVIFKQDFIVDTEKYCENIYL